MAVTPAIRTCLRAEMRRLAARPARGTGPARAAVRGALSPRSGRSAPAAAREAATPRRTVPPAEVRARWPPRPAPRGQALVGAAGLPRQAAEQESAPGHGP